MKKGGNYGNVSLQKATKVVNSWNERLETLERATIELADKVEAAGKLADTASHNEELTRHRLDALWRWRCMSFVQRLRWLLTGR